MISFSRADLDRFLSEDNGEPVVMLNVLRFLSDSGRERYLEYLTMAVPLVARYHARLCTQAIAPRRWRRSRDKTGTL